MNKLIRGYVLERGKIFRIQNNWELSKMGEEPTTIKIVTYCKVSEIAPGNLQLEGNGFTLALKYNSKNVSPKIEFKEVTDRGLSRYWSDGITRIVFEVKSAKLKGKNEFVISEVK